MLNAIKQKKKTGQELFHYNNKKLETNVLSFWQWSSSELLGNALRGILAEFIIASALDLLDKPREEWDSYDLLTKNKLKIEIKSSAYLQSWKQNNLSIIKFGIQPTLQTEPLISKTIPSRQADVYIFCVLNHKDKNTVDPLNLNQWDFYVLETEILNIKSLTQKTITLKSLLSINPIKVKYDEIKKEVYRLELKRNE